MIRRVLLLGAALSAFPAASLAGEEPANAATGAHAAAATGSEPAAALAKPSTASAPAAASGPAASPAKPSDAKQPDNSLERWRTPLDALAERMIGTASRAVRFDWRQSSFGVGLVGSDLLELNNFTSFRAGLAGRTPLGGLMGELALTRVFTDGSASTEKLALTPYRQSGRPSRFELDFNLALPLFEGVSTPRPGFFPATELVFSLNAGFRYLYYWGQMSGMKWQDVAGALMSPRLTDKELQNIEGDRLPGMQIDGARYNLLGGLSFDVYFQSGLYLEPRVLVAIPVFSGFATTGLGWWWELNLGLGWMF